MRGLPEEDLICAKVLVARNVPCEFEPPLLNVGMPKRRLEWKELLLKTQTLML